MKTEQNSTTPSNQGTSSDERNTRGSIFRGFLELRNFLKGRFSLEDDKAHRDDVVASIYKGVEFKGVNLWVLIFATLIASLGLNINSAAVIIGAMLISPIMGPIMGIGLAVGINDFELFKKSMRNYVLMFSVAIVASTIYFFITPLGSAQTELLARTAPTTYDVLIALFGGLAGMIAQSRKDRTSTVIPGVAIATALIPPLCTAGFGIATGQFIFFIGALYLFFINTVFIALATYIMVRFLDYEKKVFLDKQRERNVKRMMLFIALITFIPSVILGFRMVRVSIFEANADRFVESVFTFPNSQVIEYHKDYTGDDEGSIIEVILLGETLPETVIDGLRTQMTLFGLEDAKLYVRQPSKSDNVDMGDLTKGYAQLLQEKNIRITELEEQLQSATSDAESSMILASEDIAREAAAIFPGIMRIVVDKSYVYTPASSAQDTTVLCVVKTAVEFDYGQKERLEEWLKTRTKSSDVKVFFE